MSKMAGKSKKTQRILVAIVVVLAAVLVYSLFPYVASTSVSSLKSGETTYIYGTVDSRVASGGPAAFELNDGSGHVWVLWNGTLPSDGQKVLVHGTYHTNNFLVFSQSDFQASSVTGWPV